METENENVFTASYRLITASYRLIILSNWLLYSRASWEAVGSRGARRHNVLSILLRKTPDITNRARQSAPVFVERFGATSK